MTAPLTVLPAPTPRRCRHWQDPLRDTAGDAVAGKGINLDAIETEKRAMIAACQAGG